MIIIIIIIIIMIIIICSSKPNTCCEDSVEPTQDETILLSAHKNVIGIESERNVP